jgi:hypothetical protein
MGKSTHRQRRPKSFVVAPLKCVRGGRGNLFGGAYHLVFRHRTLNFGLRLKILKIENLTLQKKTKEETRIDRPVGTS